MIHVHVKKRILISNDRVITVFVKLYGKSQHGFGTLQTAIQNPEFKPVFVSLQTFELEICRFNECRIRDPA